MFILEDHDADHALVIRQVAHAQLAWQIADHWGNRAVARPRPRAETVTAILLHDAGWAEAERVPHIEPSGSLVPFDRMPTHLHLDIWQRSITIASQFSAFIGLLVAEHHHWLARFKQGATEDERRLLAELVAWIEERTGRWRTELQEDPRFAEALAEPTWGIDRRLMAACDTMAVHLCAGWDGPATLPAVSRKAEEIEVHAERIAPDAWRLRPWPLVGRRLTVTCEGRVVGPETTDPMSVAPTTVRFTLLAPGEPLT